MGMFTAYFDASGNGADKEPGASLFISGFVSSAEKWLEFDEAWIDLLESPRHGLSSPFHMAEFETGEHGNEWNHERRQAFLKDAVHLIQRYTFQPFSHGVVIDDLRRIFEEYELPKGNPPQPYPWCGLRVCEQVVDWVEREVGGKVRGEDTVEFLFETGDLHRGIFVEVAEETLGITPQLRKKSQPIAFQACSLSGCLVSSQTARQ